MCSLKIRFVYTEKFEDKFGFSHNPKSMNISIINPKLLKSISGSVVPYFQKDFHKQTQINFNSLWEIQPQNTYSGSIPKSSDIFRLKNIVSRLYLALDKNSEKFFLVNDGNLDECYFYFQKKALIDLTDDKIPYNESLLIVSAINSKLKVDDKQFQDGLFLFNPYFY